MAKQGKTTYGREPVETNTLGAEYRQPQSSASAVARSIRCMARCSICFQFCDKDKGHSGSHSCLMGHQWRGLGS